MFSTRIRRVLQSVNWRYSTHHSRDGRKPEVEQLVQQHYNARGLEGRGVEHAEIVYVRFHIILF